VAGAVVVGNCAKVQVLGIATLGDLEVEIELAMQG
jgi:hypothetical protein